MKKIYYLIVVLLITSCSINVQQEIENIESLLDVKLEDGYTIENKEYTFAIGDSVTSFDVVFTDAAFDAFFNKVKDKFEIIDKNILEDIQIEIDYYKNFEFEDTRVHMSINILDKKLHYAIVDL